jgi:hypothetical protein
MTNRLLDQQISLLEFLTSSASVFDGGTAAPHDHALHGIDGRLLHLEARLSHEKRMEKITAILPRTFEILGSDKAAIVREFIEAYPPVNISYIENARQFYEFLAARLGRLPAGPPYLGDVMACEFAFARAVVEADGHGLPSTDAGVLSAHAGIRRGRGVILLRCVYDIRALFEEGLGTTTPAARDTPLAIACPQDSDQPIVVEMLPLVFDLLDSLDEWTDPTTSGLDETPELRQLVRELAERGLLEVRR